MPQFVGRILRLAHVENGNSGAGAGNRHIRGTDVQHRFLLAIARIGGHSNARVHKHIGIVRKRERIDVIASRWYLEQFTIRSGVIQSCLQYIGIVASKTRVSEMEQTYWGGICPR